MSDETTDPVAALAFIGPQVVRHFEACVDEAIAEGLIKPTGLTGTVTYDPKSGGRFIFRAASGETGMKMVVVSLATLEAGGGEWWSLAQKNIRVMTRTFLGFAGMAD